ncbi:MAG: hypothetical protein KIS74_02870 [Burkholderiales bacterium]|nr:hypothetical protein [Burkholderiales bacterium]
MSTQREPDAYLVVEDTDRKMSPHLSPEAAKAVAATYHEMNPAHEYAVAPLVREDRVPEALRPFLSVGETEDCDWWCLWCIPPNVLLPLDDGGRGREAVGGEVRPYAGRGRDVG